MKPGSESHWMGDKYSPVLSSVQEQLKQQATVDAIQEVSSQLCQFKDCACQEGAEVAEPLVPTEV